MRREPLKISKDHRRRRFGATPALLLLSCSVMLVRPSVLSAQSVCGDSVRIAFHPPKPRNGTLFTIRVLGVEREVSLDGHAGGEALHFTEGTGGARESMAPAPIDSVSLHVSVVCAAGAQVDTIARRLELARGSYPLEKLRVAPEFSAPPDSALQARMRREGERAAAVGRMAHETPRLWRLPFVAPRPSRITSRFGKGREFNGTVTSRHMGTDFAGAIGAPVRAANRGVVRLVDSFYLGGNVVYIDHGAGLLTAYLHLSRHTVAEGDTVEQGTVIGRVGATGRVTGPHLHFIARYGATSVDPLSLLSEPKTE